MGQTFQNRAYCINRLQLIDIRLQLTRWRSFWVVKGSSSPANTVGSLAIVYFQLRTSR